MSFWGVRCSLKKIANMFMETRTYVPGLHTPAYWPFGYRLTWININMFFCSLYENTTYSKFKSPSEQAGNLLFWKEYLAPQIDILVNACNNILVFGSGRCSFQLKIISNVFTSGIEYIISLQNLKTSGYWWIIYLQETLTYMYICTFG